MQAIKEAPNTTNSIATNPKKKPNGNFMNFFNDLGKTTTASKTQELEQKQAQKQILDKNKDSVLNNILKAKNEEQTTDFISPKRIIPKEKDSPNIKNPLLQQLPFSVDNKASSKDTPLNTILKGEIPKPTKIIDNPNLAQNETTTNESKTAESSKNAEIKENKQNIKEVKNTNKNLPNTLQNEKTPSKQNTAREITKNNEAKSSIKSSETNKTNVETENTTNQINAPLNTALNPTIDSTPNALEQNVANNPNPKEQNNSNDTIKPKVLKKATLNIQDTLKYGAFKAFDSLSLLKPSDGKKLSDLIKKADELSLNLEKIKLQTNKPNIAENTLEPKKATNSTTNLPNQKVNQNQLNQPNITPSIPKNTESSTEKISNLQNQIQNESTTKEDSKDLAKDSKSNDSQKDSTKDSIKEAPKEPLKDILNKNENAKEIQSSRENQKDNLKEVQKDSTINENLAKKELQIDKNIQAQEQKKEPLENENMQNKDIKPASFKEQKKEIKNEDSQKAQKLDSNNNNNNIEAQNNSKVEQTQKIFDAKETMRNFIGQLRQEIINYKPPLSKITLELNPASLGSVEVSITHQGKNIQIALNANQNTLNLFIQNQSELRSALSQIGYENIAISFSNGTQMGFSDSSGKWNYQSANNNNKFGNENSLENDEMANFEITIINNYA
ncbi:MAG: flagellar hook-length control protein FliK [Helicobacteraceae bacterium]|nr:flagellar hook-length control protein FliK [Helicobacteraceae bacterium]